MFKQKIENAQEKNMTTHYSETPIKSNQNLSKEVLVEDDNKIEVTYYILFVEDHHTMEMMIIMIVSRYCSVICFVVLLFFSLHKTNLTLSH